MACLVMMMVVAIAVVAVSGFLVVMMVVAIAVVVMGVVALVLMAVVGVLAVVVMAVIPLSVIMVVALLIMVLPFIRLQMHVKIICVDSAFLLPSKMQMVAVHMEALQCLFQPLSAGA